MAQRPKAMRMPISRVQSARRKGGPSYSGICAILKQKRPLGLAPPAKTHECMVHRRLCLGRAVGLVTPGFMCASPERA
jgi:hypothetical protein